VVDRRDLRPLSYGRLWYLAWALVAGLAAGRVMATETPDEHVLRLASELRCVVCQNQTIADSQADLALQLKAEIGRQVSAGATDEQIRQFMVQRYGEFVLYRPSFSPANWLLWGAPPVLLLIGGAVFLLSWRDRQVQSSPDSEWASEDASDPKDVVSSKPRPTS
jgi:cytochrome c-type biogenesis protein CcmH